MFPIFGQIEKREMVKRCIYCNYELGEDSVIDICETCMYKVWGLRWLERLLII